MASSLSVPYTIVVPDGIREEMTDQGFTAMVRFKCAWTDRYQLARDLLGTTIAVGSAVFRTTPYQYPTSRNLFCLPPLSIEPLGKLSTTSDGWVAYPKAIITAQFRVPTLAFDNSDPSGQPWTTTSMNISGEFLTLPDTAYHFPGGESTNQPIGRVVPQAEIVTKRHWLPYLPVNEMLSLIGKVNAAPFSVGDYVAPAGTLLFLGGPTEPGADPTGNRSQECEYRFVYRPIPWNQYAKRDGTFDAPTDGSGNPVYQSGDFSILP